MTPITQKEAIEQANILVKASRTAMMSYNDASGYPNVKGMGMITNNSIKEIYFITSLSTNKVKQYKRDSKACLYFLNEKKEVVIFLIGNIEIFTDIETKKNFWHNNFLSYFPGGAEDPELTIL